MDVERNSYLEACLNEKKGEQYDVVVSYSGGKDSAYLIYLLKEVYKLRVIAVSVDNGFEFSGVVESLNEFTDNVGVPLKVIAPNPSFFAKLYKNLVMNPGSLQDGKRNHICHICNNLIWSYIVLFAAENNIPYVASGLGLEQLNSGRNYPLEIDQLANRIAEKSTRKIFQMAYKYICDNPELMNDEEFINNVSKMKNLSSSVSTVYPYIYHNVSVNEQKELLQKYGNWHPLNKVDIKDYVSSGCRVMTTLVREMEKLELVVLNEREEAKRMHAAGLLNDKQVSFAYNDVTHAKVKLDDPIFETFGVKDYLTKIAKERNQL